MNIDAPQPDPKPDFIQHAEKLELAVTDDGKIPEEELAEIQFQQLVHDGRVTPSQIPDEYLSADTVHDRLDELEKVDRAEARVSEDWQLEGGTDSERKLMAEVLSGEGGEELFRKLQGQLGDRLALAEGAAYTPEEKHNGDLEDLAMAALSDWLDGRTIGISRDTSPKPYAWYWCDDRDQDLDGTYLSAADVHTLSRLSVAAFRVGR